MLRIQNLVLPPEGTPEQLKTQAAKVLGVRPDKILGFTPVRQSIDARKKADVHWVMTVDVSLEKEDAVLKRVKSPNVKKRPPQKPYTFPVVTRESTLSPVVVGTGPAGLFAAFLFAFLLTRCFHLFSVYYYKGFSFIC